VLGEEHLEMSSASYCTFMSEALPQKVILYVLRGSLAMLTTQFS